MIRPSWVCCSYFWASRSTHRERHRRALLLTQSGAEEIFPRADSADARKPLTIVSASSGSSGEITGRSGNGKRLFRPHPAYRAPPQRHGAILQGLGFRPIALRFRGLKVEFRNLGAGWEICRSLRRCRRLVGSDIDAEFFGAAGSQPTSCASVTRSFVTGFCNDRAGLLHVADDHRESSSLVGPLGPLEAATR